MKATLLPFRSGLAIFAICFACQPVFAATTLSNPVGAPLPGETLAIDGESFHGFRFSVTGTLGLSAVSAIFAESDGSVIVAAILRNDGTGFPSVEPLNPGHSGLVDFGMIDPAAFVSPTELSFTLDAILEPGDYTVMFISMAFGDQHALQAFEATTDSDGVVFSQELDAGGFTLPGTRAWGASLLQPDIRITGTAIPEPASVTLGALAACMVFGLRRRR